MYQIIICDKDFGFREDFHCQVEQVSQNLFMECSIIQCKEVKQAEEIFKNRKTVDLLFLGIPLGESSGHELGKYIREELCNFHTQIVYVSQKPEHTFQLFETMPFDFLLKPVLEEKLQNTMKRFLKKQDGVESFFGYKDHKTTRMISFNEILYFQSVSPKLIVHTQDGIKEFYRKLDDIEKQLPEYFVRIHKSYIVNIHYVRTFCYDSVSLSDTLNLPISRSYKKQVSDYLAMKLSN